MSDRDPRIDPAAGDVVANASGDHFYVLYVTADSVYHQQVLGELDETSLVEWRANAANDTVIRRGDHRAPSPRIF